ncbi:hypothetical protein EVAR_101442_1 [Eumeta japonica]|uniref:Uncharacterized protein n=1 Tax=Eumeta variegata TaxID=151549 RepID=A0A4C1TAV4_EUMVA|nr:hypothetical protein EVAR_101442_1 [Eumeta japonica]
MSGGNLLLITHKKKEEVWDNPFSASERSKRAVLEASKPVGMKSNPIEKHGHSALEDLVAVITAALLASIPCKQNVKVFEHTKTKPARVQTLRLKI